jgi:microcystin-dependent protein
MSQLGSGLGTSFPASIDTRTTEVNSPAAGKTKARAEVINDLLAATVAIETSLGTPGLIQMYAGATAPSGWLLCNGAAISRTVTYTGLYAVIGTTYGVGDGSTTFNLPDFRGVFPKGAGTTTRDNDTGYAIRDDTNTKVYHSATLGTYYADKMQGHLHYDFVADGSGASVITDTAPSKSETITGATNTMAQDAGNPITNGINGTPRTGLTTEPQSLGINFIIKY